MGLPGTISYFPKAHCRATNHINCKNPMGGTPYFQRNSLKNHWRARKNKCPMTFCNKRILFSPQPRPRMCV